MKTYKSGSMLLGSEFNKHMQEAFTTIDDFMKNSFYDVDECQTLILRWAKGDINMATIMCYDAVANPRANELFVLLQQDIYHQVTMLYERGQGLKYIAKEYCVEIPDEDPDVAPQDSHEDAWDRAMGIL